MTKDELTAAVRQNLTRRDWSHALRLIRHAKCINTIAMSKLTGIHKCTISEYETGLRNYPGERVVNAYSQALNIQPSQLVELARLLKRYKNLESLIDIKRVIDEEQSRNREAH